MDEGYKVEYQKSKYVIDVFRVTQSGVTSVIYDVKAYHDATYSVENPDKPGVFEDKRVVVLTNPYNDEIYYKIDEPAVVNFVSNNECLAIKGDNITSAVIFRAIYGHKFDKMNKELDEEIKTEEKRIK